MDGRFAIRIDDDPRLCLFGDKDPLLSGGVNILNVKLTARAMASHEICSIHRELSHGIAKSWVVTKV